MQVLFSTGSLHASGTLLQPPRNTRTHTETAHASVAPCCNHSLSLCASVARPLNEAQCISPSLLDLFPSSSLPDLTPTIPASLLLLLSLAAWRRVAAAVAAGDQCVLQTTPWSQCSRSCGTGISTRVTNDNARCKLVKETRLCNVRPCSSVSAPAKVFISLFIQVQNLTETTLYEVERLLT